jgi:hypothetical protein
MARVEKDDVREERIDRILMSLFAFERPMQTSPWEVLQIAQRNK